MYVFSRLALAINQSFRLIFGSVRKGFLFIFRAIKKAVSLLSDLVLGLHDSLATLIQLMMNISSLLFVLFVPFAFFFDPLHWSRYLGGLITNEYIFWGRMALGAFFSLVAYYLVVDIIKSWRDAEISAEGSS